LDGISAGELIPKLRTGGFLPSILEPLSRVNQALYGVVMEDIHRRYLHPQIGNPKSQVSRICQEID
jgi:putative transposase